MKIKHECKRLCSHLCADQFESSTPPPPLRNSPPFQCNVQIPPPWTRCTVKCPGYAGGGGGELKIRIDRLITLYICACAHFQHFSFTEG